MNCFFMFVPRLYYCVKTIISKLMVMDIINNNVANNDDMYVAKNL